MEAVIRELRLPSVSYVTCWVRRLNLYSTRVRPTLDGRLTATNFRMRAMPRPITKFSDHFGQFDITLVCAKCGHRRKTDPTTLAKLCRVPMDTLIEQALKRLRCSQCSAKECTHTATLPGKPRRYSALPR
jgi:hypothetical protein